MDFVREWLVGIVAAGIVVSLAHALAPPGTVRRVVQMAGGLIILLTVVRPLIQTQWQSLSLSGADLERQVERYAGQTKQAGITVMKKIIEEKTSAYIENEAKTRGLSLRADVEAKTPPGEETPLPYRVRLTAPEPIGEQQRLLFSDWMEQTLDIPETRQSWAEGG